MGIYKKRIQKKINDDLKKLKENEKEILKLIDDIKINQWVLLTPEFKSKDLISYCNKKKKEVGSDMMLVSLAKAALEKANKPTEVQTGRFMFEV